MPDNESQNPKPWYRQFWPWFVMIPPFAGVVSGIGMLVLADSQPLSLVVDDYTRIDVETAEKFARDRRAEALALAAKIDWHEDGGDELRMTIELTAGGWPPAERPEYLTLDFSHPTQSSRDFSVRLNWDGLLYAGEASPAPSGRYYLELLPPESTWRLAAEVAGYGSSLMLAAAGDRDTTP